MLVERDAELETLAGLLEAAGHRRGGIVRIVGEAGIGKTSLLDEFIRRSGGRAQIVVGMCDALFTPRPLGPVYEISAGLGDKCARAAESRLAADGLFSLIHSAVQSSVQPVIMLIEDVHWADFGTLDFIRFIGRRISAMPLLLVVSYRDDEVGADHPLYRTIGDLPSKNIHQISLAPLTAEGIERLNKENRFHTDEIVRVTGGNPFFVTELLASKGGARDFTAPGSVREAVNARLSRVSALERKFLEAASMIPVPIDPKLLDPMFDGSAEMLALACVGRGLLKTDGDSLLRFRHELARLATASRLTAVEQKQIHESLLTYLLERESPPLAQLVHHAAGALDTDVVLNYAPMAADEAAKVGAHREAAAHLSTALEFVSEAGPEQAAELYESWAYEAGLSLKIDEEVIDARRHAVTLWRALGRMDKVGENLRWLSRLHWYRGEANKAARYSDDALSVLEDEGDSSGKAMALSLRSQLHMLNDRMDEAVDWGTKALRMAETFDSAEVKIHALNNLGSAKLLRGNTDGLADMDESLRLATSLGRHEDVARVYTNLSEYAVEFRDFELAERVLSDGIAFDTEHDLDSWTFYLIGRMAQLRFDQGRFEDAKRICEGVLDRKDQTLLMRLPAQMGLAKAHLRLGLSDANEKMSEAFQSALSTGEQQYIVPMRTAFIEAATDNAAYDTEEHFNAIVSLPKQGIMRWRRAEVWFWSRQCGMDVTSDHFDDLPEPYLCLLEEDYQSAASQFSKLGLCYHEAYSHFLRGDEAGLITSHKLFMGMGARKMEERCRARAMELGISGKLARKSRGPYSASRSHPLGLTQREQEILGELAKGATNREIAETLSRSRRTVENHVSSVLQKLNVSSRTDVLLRVQNEPWLLGE